MHVKFSFDVIVLEFWILQLNKKANQKSNLTKQPKIAYTTSTRYCMGSDSGRNQNKGNMYCIFSECVQVQKKINSELSESSTQSGIHKRHRTWRTRHTARFLISHLFLLLTAHIGVSCKPSSICRCLQKRLKIQNDATRICLFPVWPTIVCDACTAVQNLIKPTPIRCTCVWEGVPGLAS